MYKNEEQIKKLIAHMNVFSQHQKVMSEFAKTNKKGRKIKNKK